MRTKASGCGKIGGEETHVFGAALRDGLPEGGELGIERSSALKDAEERSEALLNAAKSGGVDAEFLRGVFFGANGLDVVAFFGRERAIAAGGGGFNEQAEESGLFSDGGVDGVEGDSRDLGNGGHGGGGVAFFEEYAPGGIEDGLAGEARGVLPRRGIVRALFGTRHITA